MVLFCGAVWCEIAWVQRQVLNTEEATTQRKQMNPSLLRAFALLVLIISSAAERFVIGINPNSSIASSIGSIAHDTDSRQIVIELAHIRRVENPTFLVRMSGPAVYLLKLVEQKMDTLIRHSVANFFNPRKNEYYFSYPSIVDPGVYFVEILVIFATEFDPSAYTKICVEDYANGANVVGLPYSYNVSSVVPSSSPIPRWAHVMRNDPTYQSLLLPTRYQPRTCGKREGELCQSTLLDLWQYNSYDWVDKPAYGHFMELLPNVATVCLVGASHAREMTQHGHQLGIKKVRFQFIESRFPSDFKIKYLVNHGCDYSIIGYGQWPASFVSIPVPYTAEQFTTEMQAVMELIAAYEGHAKTFVVSTNYNGNHLVSLSCPPFDFRTPPVIDMINDILRTLSAKYAVNYIDLNHIMGPMWDSAQDYCHPKGKVFTAEVEWILYHILSATIKIPDPTAVPSVAPTVVPTEAPTEASTGDNTAVTTTSDSVAATDSDPTVSSSTTRAREF